MKCFSLILCGHNSIDRDIRLVRSDIEDLAFPSRSLRESGKAGLRVCIEHCCALTETPGRKQ
jgi:hypothetical protein